MSCFARESLMQTLFNKHTKRCQINYFMIIDAELYDSRAHVPKLILTMGQKPNLIEGCGPNIY